MKNTKISNSLKKYHHKKRTKLQRHKELKIITWILTLIILTGIISTHKILNPVKAEAPYERMNNTFPVANDINLKELSVKDQIIYYARLENFEWIDYLLRLSTCENRKHIVDLKANAGNKPSYSIDRGLFAINSYWHSEVSDECSYSVECSTKWTMWMIKSGRQHEWVCNDLVLKNPNKYNW